jgi:hypothetical protein
MPPMQRASFRKFTHGAYLATIAVAAVAWSCAAGENDTAAALDPQEASVAPDAAGTDDAPAASDDAADDSSNGQTNPTGDDAASDDTGTGEDASGGDTGGGTIDAGGHDAADGAIPKDAGDSSAPVDAAPTLDACGTGTAAIVINEVQTSGAAGAGDEWVELFNPQACAINIGSWQLRHASATGTTIDKVFTAASGVSIAAGGYAVVAGTSYSASAPTIGAFTAGVFADTGGGLGLYDASGTLIDSMGYGPGATNPFVETTSAPAEGTSQSIARVPNGAETGNNASDFKAANPTPGAEN